MLFVPSVEYNIIAYTDSEGLCVCCDGCDRWFNVECTTIKKKKLPDVYFCEECIYKLIVITFLWYDSSQVRLHMYIYIYIYSGRKHCR